MQRHEATLVGLSQLRVACSAVLGLLGLVAGAGVVIALHVTVRRRRRELVLLTALGATWGQVFSTLQATGLVACALGVAAGLGLGLSWCSALERAKVALDPTVFPVDHLPLVLRGGDVFGITIAAWVVAACAVGPVAAAAVRRVVVQGFRE
jgi:ABC-type lipoprotein release transport system permease subunit